MPVSSPKTEEQVAMKRLNLAGISLLVILALGAVMATTAPANPTILPTPTEKEPLNFEGASSGQTTVTFTQEGEKGVKHQVKCEKVKTLKSAFTTSETAKDVHLVFEGNCKLTSAPESKCKTEGTENGMILILVDATLVDILPGSVLTLGVRFDLLNLKLKPEAIVITCGVALVEKKGSFIGRIDGVTSLVKTKTAEVLAHEAGGKQEFKECDLLEEVCLDLPGKTHLKFELLAKFTAAEPFFEVRMEATVPITFEKEAEVHF
jgi:hypothetical protein